MLDFYDLFGCEERERKEGELLYAEFCRSLSPSLSPSPSLSLSLSLSLSSSLFFVWGEGEGEELV